MTTPDMAKVLAAQAALAIEYGRYQDAARLHDAAASHTDDSEAAEAFNLSAQLLAVMPDRAGSWLDRLRRWWRR